VHNKNYFRFISGLLGCLTLVSVSTACSQSFANEEQSEPLNQVDATQIPMANFRELDPENVIVMDTSKGRIIIELASRTAPLHTARIKELSRAHFYDGIGFHRVIEGFMAQGGDPLGDGTGGSQLPDLAQEFNFRRGADFPFVKAVDKGGITLGWVDTIPVSSQPDVLMSRTFDGKVSAWGNHCPAVTSMARSSDPNSANSQFFLMRNTYPSLDRNYTVWGRAVIGLDVMRALKTGEPVVNPDTMTSVRVLADLPAAQRPHVWVERLDSPSFQSRLANAIARDGDRFTNCNLMPAVLLR